MIPRELGARRLTARSALGLLAALWLTVVTASTGVASAAPTTAGPSSATDGSSGSDGASGGSPTPVTGPAVVSGPKVPPGVQTGADHLGLLGQSTDVEAGHTWEVHLAVTAAAPAADRLRIQVYNRLTTRTAFDQTLSGHIAGDLAWHSGTMELGDLPPDTGGGVTLGVPVDRAGSEPDLQDFLVSRDQSGIFPVQVQLLDSQAHTLDTLTTYLVFSAGSPSQTGFPKLDVSLSLAVGAPPAIPSSAPLTAAAGARAVSASAGRLPGATVATLGAEVAALARHPGVPLSLTVTPQTADALAAEARKAPAAPSSGSATPSTTVASPSTTATSGIGPSPPTTAPAGSLGSDAAGTGSAGNGTPTAPARAASTVSSLSKLIAAGDELLPSTYVSTALSSLAAAGLTGDIATQFDQGAASLGTTLHHVPATTTWVVDGPLDAATLRLLEARGATRFVVPAADLRALPKDLRTFTVAAPAKLAGGGGNLTVDAADPQLSAHFSNVSDQVLAASQLLAELAMIQLETPSRHRGVAVIPPAGWVANSAFLDTLLTGLDANPLIQPVTADQLFAAIPAASGRSQVVRTLAPSPPAAPLARAATIKLARAAAQGFAAVLPGARATAEEMARRILISESSQLTTAQRATVLGPVVAAATPLDHGISLPRNTSITLTARKGDLPLTILDDPSLRAHVELRLSSDKLNFEPFSPPGGHCRSTSPSSETCQLVLTVAVTTIKVPVEARTSGVFTLSVGLFSPNGSLAFGTNRDTVRSTAVSGVGVILIILAALGLGYWWLRSIRHGRRARRLVAVSEGATGEGGSDLGDPNAEEVGKGTSGDDDAGATAASDDVFADFFSSPAPQYPASPSIGVPSPSSPVSPSPGGTGPT